MRPRPSPILDTLLALVVPVVLLLIGPPMPDGTAGTDVPAGDDAPRTEEVTS